jgi:beta-barrel assembly-enhancing protease
MRYLATLILAASAALAVGCSLGGGSGRAEPPALAVDQEVEITRLALPEVQRRFGGSVANLSVEAYVRTVAERLARHTPMHQLPYRVIVLESPMPVAIALPGGGVFVSRGILLKLESEDELAALLAHLAAHINARHAEQETDPRLVTAAAAALCHASIPGSLDRPAGPDVARLIARWVGMRFTPAQEEEADRLGMDYLAATGYNPGSMIWLVEMLGSIRGPGEAELAAMHPGSASRLEAVRAVLARKYEGRGGRVARLEYQREVLDRLKS